MIVCIKARQGRGKKVCALVLVISFNYLTFFILLARSQRDMYACRYCGMESIILVGRNLTLLVGCIAVGHRISCTTWRSVYHVGRRTLNIS